MTPRRAKGRSLTIDRLIGGRRFRFATGARTPKEFKRYETMVDALIIQGRLDLLEGLLGREPLYHPAELLTAFTRNDFDRLPTPEEIGSVEERWERWGESRDKAGYAWSRLTKAGISTIRSFPQAVKRMREQMTENPRAFELYKNEAQAFLRTQLGEEHPIYKQVKRIPGFGKRSRERGRPLSVDEVGRLLNDLEPPAADIVWAMCATGMGVKEYWTDGFDVLPDRIRIHGQKRRTRERDVPRFTDVAMPRLTVKQMEYRLNGFHKDKADTGFRLYDFRRTFARACEECGIVESNRAAYMGHGARTMTQLYTMGELPGQFAGDGARLAEYWKPLGERSRLLRLA